MLGALGIMRAIGGCVMSTAFRRVHHAYCWVVFKSDGQEISTIEWQELKNEFRLFSDYKKLLRIEEI